MFVRYYTAETILQLSNSSYQLPQELIKMAEQHNHRFVQLGDLPVGGKFGEDNIFTQVHSVEFDITEWAVPDPVFDDRFDRFVCIPIKHWPKFYHTIEIVCRKNNIPIFHAPSQKPLTATTAIEFADQLRPQILKSHPFAVSDDVTIDTMMECAIKLTEAWSNTKITLWNHDLWQAALSGAEVFNDYNLTPEEMQRKLPQPGLWLLDIPIPMLAELSADRPIEAKLLGMFVMPMRFLAEESHNYIDVFARLLIVQVPNCPRPLLEWVTIGVGTNDNKLGKPLPSDSKRGVSASQTWALLEFMNQPIIKVTETPPPHHVRRQAERVKKTLPKVQTVYLRRIYHHDKDIERSPSAEKRKFNWQWLVGGHWRNQPYPSLGCTKRIYIAPYYKGPEDKPMKQPGVKLFKVVR